MLKNRNIGESLTNAINGFKVLIKDETNIRIQICAGFFVLVMAAFMDVSRLEYALLVFVVFLVILCEGINTAIEQAVNTAVQYYDERARKAKDAASSIPLIAAVLSVIIGVLILYKPEKIWEIIHRILGSPVYLVLVVSYAAFSFLFVRGGQRGQK